MALMLLYQVGVHTVTYLLQLTFSHNIFRSHTTCIKRRNANELFPCFLCKHFFFLFNVQITTKIPFLFCNNYFILTICLLRFNMIMYNIFINGRKTAVERHCDDYFMGWVNSIHYDCPSLFFWSSKVHLIQYSTYLPAVDRDYLRHISVSNTKLILIFEFYRVFPGEQPL